MWEQIQIMGPNLLDDIAIKAMVAFIQKGEGDDVKHLAAKSYTLALRMLEEKDKIEKELKNEKD